MFVNLEEETVSIDGEDFELIGLDEVGFMIDEDYQGKFRIWNTKRVLGIKEQIDSDLFNRICRAVESKLEDGMGWV